MPTPTRCAATPATRSRPRHLVRTRVFGWQQKNVAKSQLFKRTSLDPLITVHQPTRVQKVASHAHFTKRAPRCPAPGPPRRRCRCSRRRSACGLRSRSTCRRARCSSCTCTPPCCTISTWTNRIPALAHGVVHQHGKAVRAPRAAVRRRGVAARRADAFAAKQRAACVEEQPFSHQLDAWRSAALSWRCAPRACARAA